MPITTCLYCGAALPLPDSHAPVVAFKPAEPVHARSVPPMPPRPVPRGYLMRRLAPDAGAIIGMVFAILGGVFLPLGVSLALSLGEASLSWVFIPLGLAFLGSGLALLAWRVLAARWRMAVLRDGLAALGCIDRLQRDYTVQVNHRSPWVIAYSFNVMGRSYKGKVDTLREPEPDLRPSAPVYVHYDPNHPEENTLYLDL